MSALANPASRQVVLAVAAGALVLGLAAKTFRGGPDEPVGAVTRSRSNGTAPVATAAVGRDRESLSQRYKPIVEAEVFRSRSFRKKSEKNERREERREDRRDERSVDTLALQLTGIFALDDGLAALLESRGTGKGMFVRKGDKVGDRTVAEVGTQSVVLQKEQDRRALSLGERMNFATREVQGMKDLGPVRSATVVNDPSKPVLTEEQKEDVLKKLREKRKQSMGGQ